ncbi:MAG: hypothetical protein Q9O24_01905 [Gammaproteobacteria bacterium]|nr:hypothetical protein [Gammaproteobacteria bacterium]
MKRESNIDQEVDLDLEETLLDSESDLTEAIRCIREQGVDFASEDDEVLSFDADETVVEEDLGALKAALAAVRRAHGVEKEQHQTLAPAPDFVLDEPSEPGSEDFSDSLAKLRRANNIHEEPELEADRTLMDGDQAALQEALAKIREGGF